jgi:hypothetical protein
MKLIPIVAISEVVDVKKGGIVTYGTDLIVDQEGIILMENPEGIYGMVLIDQIHRGGKVTVIMRPINTPVRKYSIGDTVALLAVF